MLSDILYSTQLKPPSTKDEYWKIFISRCERAPQDLAGPMKMLFPMEAEIEVTYVAQNSAFAFAFRLEAQTTLMIRMGFVFTVARNVLVTEQGMVDLDKTVHNLALLMYQAMEIKTL